MYTQVEFTHMRNQWGSMGFVKPFYLFCYLWKQFFDQFNKHFLPFKTFTMVQLPKSHNNQQKAKRKNEEVTFEKSA